MHTKITKTVSAISLRVIYTLMILSMLLAGVGVTPAHAASPDTISGNAGVAGATITWVGSGSDSDGSMIADGSGNYSFEVTYGSGWFDQWNGTVTPSKTGYTFSPSSRNYNISSNQTNQNYTATPVTYTISGSTGTAGANATITYTGGSTTANSSGSYSFTVSSGWSGTVTPSKAGYDFNPPNRSYTNVTSNQSNQNYTAVSTLNVISGNAGVGSATITYTGGSTTANGTGDYSFTVSPGWSGTVTPSKTGFSFVPSNRAYTNVVASQTTQNYTARPVVFKFASMGDAQAEAANFTATVNQIATLNPALVIFNGDLEDAGVVSTEMNPMVGALKTANLFNNTFLVRGNHDDRVDGSAALWESYFETAPNIKVLPPFVTNKTALNSSSDQLNYSFDYGNSIFVGLDVPEDIGVMTQAQLNFLDARLTYAEGQGLTHAFIFFHGPEYPVESTHSYCETRTDDSCTPAGFIDVINAHPIVSATLHGHEHILGYTHMDNTRVAGLTRSYEQFMTSPSGGWTYNEYLYPERMDYTYMDMESSQGFATLDVNGNSFTFNIYKVGTTQPVYSKTFSKLNTPPTISDITDKTTNEDTTTGDISFTVGDAEIQAPYLTVTAASSNTTLVPNGNIFLGGSGENRTANITPASNQSGTSTITVSVYDGNVTTSDTFLLTVNAVNDAPVADAQSVSTSWNTPKDITLTGSDVEGSSLTYSIVDNPAHGSLSGSGANRTYTPSTGYSGTDTFTFTANDGTVDSAPATVSILVTAHNISGNAGVAGAVLSYTVGTPKTVTADGTGVYTFQVPGDWSGTVTPSKAGYTFSPTSMTYANVLADQTAQDYTVTGVTYTISGNAGRAGVTLSYTDGTPKTVTADEAGEYSFEVPYNWSGMVTPSLSGYGFIPGTKTYTNVTSNQVAQDYSTTTARVWYVDKTNTACTDTGQVGSFAVPFCTIGRGAYLATAGQIVHVLHGTYAESVFPTNNGTAGNPIIFQGDPGVTVTGTAPGTGFGSAFGLSSKSYIVIDGFNITNTWYKGIYVDASNHITLSNNRVSYAGVTSPTHPYEQGIYLRDTTDSTITGNTTDHNTCIGIRVTTGGYNLISNNISYSNYSVVESDAAGIELTGSSNNTVINNITYSNEDSGINVYLLDYAPVGTSPNDIPSTYNIVIDNLSYENGDHGIDDNNSPYNTFVGNTVQGNGTVGINVEGEATTGSHHAVVVNNIISGNGFTPPSGSFGGNLRVDTPSIDGTIIDYNLFNKESAMYQIIWNNVNYASLTAFHAAVPTQEVHGLEGNPLFVAPVASVLRQTGVHYVGLGILGNYYLSPGSPAIDSANADAPSQPVSDIDGNARVDDPATPDTGAGARSFDDRGAYEFLPLGQSLPIVTTLAVNSIATTTATGNGNITATGEPNPSQHGVVWNTTGEPTTADSKTTDGAVSATGSYTSLMTGLTPGTLYYVRAYATNAMGTVYGDAVTFTTLIAPTVTTQAVSNITTTTATGNGNLTALGVPDPTEHGVVWSTLANPTTADSKTTQGAVTATGAFTSNITGLIPGTLYHVRAYATNAAGTSYGEDLTFIAYHVPSVTTSAVNSITTTTAVGNGNVTALGVPNPSQHGVVWSTSPDPTITNSKTTNGVVSETGAFSSSMTGLTPGTLYHVRAYATNMAGTAYGDDFTFTTLLAPTVTTQSVTDITTTTATGNGNITALGTFNPIEHGVVWAITANPTTDNFKTTQGAISETGAFTSSMTGLIPGMLYHVRAYATSEAGTSYGEDATFTTLIVPTVTTQSVSSIGTTTAIGNGNVTVLGVPNPTQHGVVWSTSANPTIDNSKTTDGDVVTTGAFTSSITGLTPGLLYHVRAYATNVVGTSYGEDVTFTTLPSTTGTTTPATNAGTGTNVIVTGKADWANPTYITAGDTNYASASLSGSILSSGYLQGTNYGFAIPADAVINGIMVTIGRHESGRNTSLDVRDSTVSLLKAGVMTGNNKAATGTEWPIAPPAPASYGTPADLWGTTWTPAEINANNFGVALSVITNVNRVAYVDYMQISVTYTVTMVGSNTTVNCGAGSPLVTYGSNITCVATVVRGSGDKTPTGNVSWTTNGSGIFVTSPCALSGSNGTATCSVTYAPSSVGSGSHLITAAYAGDANFFSSNGDQTVTVNKAAATVALGSLAQTYDGTLKPATATTNPADLPVTFTYNGSADVPTDAGSYVVVGTVNDGNYQGSASDTLIIDKAASTTTVTGGTFTYTGSSHLATVSVTGAGGLSLSPIPTYSGGCVAAPINVSETIPTACTAEYTYSGDTNHYGSNGSDTIVIAKADASIVVNGYTGTFDGSEHGAILVSALGVNSEDLSASVNLDATFINVPGGIAHWTFTDVAGNYNNTGGDVDIIVYKADAAIEVTGYTGEYDGVAHGLSGTATGVLSESLSGLNLGDSFTNVPGGTANWTFSNINYKDASGNADIVITPKAALVTPDAAGKIYGDDDPSFSGTLSGFLSTDGVTAVYNRDAGENVGSYPINAVLNPAGVLSNYTITYSPINFLISAKPITVTADVGQSKVFGSDDPVFTYTSSDTQATFTGELDREEGENVGPYAIGQGTLAVVGNNYNMSFVSNDFTITAKPITVTADVGQSKVYGTDDPILTYTSSDTAATFTGALDREAGVNVGAYAIEQGTLTAGTNYTITFVSNDFTITAKPITVTADAGQSKVFGTADPIFTYTSSDTQATFTGALDRVEGEDVDAYAIEQGTLTAGTNYTITFVSNDFSISAKPITVTADAGQSKVFGAVDPILTYTSSDTDVTFTGALDREAGVNVGTYAIGQGTLTAGTNYSITFVSNDFTITAKPITVTADAGQSKVFGAVDPTFTYTSSDPAATFSGALTRVEGEDVDAYAIEQGTLVVVGNNYSMSFVSKDFTITPASATVTLTNLNQIYDGTPKSVTVTTVPAGLPVAVTYGSSPTPPTALGEYEVVATVTDPNYIGLANETLVIAQDISTHSIPLVIGWNLISFNVHPESTEISTVLSTIDGNYDLVYAWNATITSNNWLMYDPSMLPFLNSLNHLDETMGFWIHMTATDTLEVTGVIPVTTNINLYTNAGGWNLVAYPSGTNRPLPEALSDNGVGTDFSLVYAYDADEVVPWKLFDVNMLPFLNTLTELSPGWGYWVKVNVNQTWSVDYLAE